MAHQGEGRALLPRGLLDAYVPSTPTLLDHVCSKNHVPKGLIPFDILFPQNTEIGKKQQFWVGPPFNRLVPKSV